MPQPQPQNFKKYLSDFFWALFLMVSLAVPLIVSAGNAFFPSGVVYISNGVKWVGNAASANSAANAFSYRSGLAGMSMYSDEPAKNKIFAADGTYPAYTQWDVGSSVWSPVPQAAGQDMYIVIETYAGLNGWTGNSYVGGSHRILTTHDVSDAASQPPDILVEPIPTPTLSGKGLTSLTLQFSGLLDRTDIAGQGSWNDSIVGYTIYRSANSTSTPVKIGTVAQNTNGGGMISYTDSTVTQGVNYYYRVAVNFRWVNNTPNPWYETTARGPWSAALATGNPPDSIKFVAGPITSTATLPAGPITLAAYNFTSGDLGTVSSSTTINLSSNSTGQSKFYTYNGTSCGTTTVTQVTIGAGQGTVSFCYGDSLAGSWTVTATPTNGWNAIAQAGQVITVGPLDHFILGLAASQTNGLNFTGTNTVTAEDAGSNIITDFNTKSISAVLSVSNGGAVANASLASADFVSGVANVTAKNFSYTGSSGAVIFTVTSTTGKTGTSTVTISPGALAAVKIRDSVGGLGNLVTTQALTADNTFTVAAAGYDASNNYIKDVSGTWGVTGTLDNAFTIGSSSAIFAPSHAPTSGTLTFTDGAGHNANTGAITVSPGALASFSVASALGNQTAGTAFDIGPLKALDAKGNIVTSFSATVHLTDSTGTLASTTSAVFTSGQLASQLVTITKAQSGVTVTATDTGSGKTGATNSFAVNHAPLYHFAVSFTTPQTNNKAFTGVNTITARDQWDNPITDYNTIGTAATISVASGATLQNNILAPTDFVSGTADLTAKNFVYTGTAGATTFTITAGTGQTGSSLVTIAAGDVASLVIRNGANNTGSPQIDIYNMQVSQNLVLYAAGYDLSNNYVADMPVTWSRTGTLDAPLSGPVNSINYQPLTAYTSGTITVTDTGGHSAATGVINVDRGPLDHFQLNLTTPQIDGVAFTGVNTVVAKDVGNNTIADYNIVGTGVTVTASSTGATLAHNVLAKSDFSGGIANLTAAGLTYTGPAGAILLTATAATSNKIGTSTVVINPGPLDHFVVSLNSTQLINTPFVGTNTITAKDIGGNTITNFNALVDNVTITASPTGSSTPYGLAGPTGNVLLSGSDFTSGVADVAGKLTHPGPGGSYVFTATSVSGKSGDSAPVEIDVGPLHHFGFQTITTQRAGQPFSVVVTAYAQDPQGVSHVKASYNGSVALSDDSGTVSPVTIGPFINGQATVSLTVTKALTGDILHVKDSVNTTITGDSNAFDILNGPFHHFAVSQTIPNQVAGTAFDLGRIEARDQWNNVVTDFTGPAVLSDATDTLTPSSTPVFVAGVLTNQLVNITKTKTGDVVIVTYQGSTGLSNAFNINPGAVASITISAQSGGTGAAVGDRLLSVDDGLTLYAVGYDAYNNYVNEVPGTWNVTGNLDGLPSSSVSTVTFAPVHAPTNGTITFTDAAGHAASTGTITTKHGALASFSFAITNLNQRVGLPLSSPATLTALDAKGNTILDFDASVDNVTLAASSGGSILGLGAGHTNIINTAPSFTNGVADLHALGALYAGRIGTVTWQATSASGKGGTSPALTFSAGPLDHFDVLLAGIQQNGVAFTASSTIVAADLGDNVLTDFNASADPLKVTVTPADGVISGLSSGDILNSAADFTNGISSVAGKLIFTGLKGPHIFKVTGTISGQTGTSAPIEILPGILDHLLIRNATGGAGGVIGNETLKAGDTLQLYAAGYDKSDNFIQDETASWIGTGATANFLTPVNGPSTTFNATVPGTGLILASSGSVVAQTGTVTITAGQAAKLVFLSAPYDGAYSLTPPPPHSDNAPLVVNRSSGPVIVQAQDIVGNVVTLDSDLALGLASTGSGSFSASDSSWAPLTSTVINSGQNQTTLYYQDPVSGTYNLTVTPSDGHVSPVSQPVVVSPVYDLNLVFTTAAQTIKAGAISGIITVELRDNSGQAATSTDPINVKLLSNSPGSPKFYFDAQGSAEITSLNIPAGSSSISFYYLDTAAGTALIHVQAANVTDGYQLMTVTGNNPAKLLITPGPLATDGQNIIQNYASNKITVQVLDNYGNPAVVSANTTIHLTSSNSATSAFAGDGTGGAWLATSANPFIVISAGANVTYFYYRDSTLGLATITASANPENNWTAATQIETIYAPVISRLAFMTPARQTDTNVAAPIITIQAQDALGNAIPVSADTAISLITSDPSGGSFALSAGGPWTAGQVVIPAGQASVSFYYKDTTPGTKTLGVSETPSLGWADAVQQIIINAGAPDHLAFISAPQTVGKNSASGALIVQLQDSQGFPTVFPTDLTINLTTDSAGGAFSTNSQSGPWGLGSVTLVASSSQAVFYYRDQNPGTYTLTATVAGHAWTASQLMAVTEGVIHQLSFISTPQSIAANAASEVITIQTQNDQGTPVAVTADTTINLTSTSGSGQFAAATSSAWGITQVVIPAGSSKVSFYYKDPSSGTFILSAAENPAKGWTAGQQQIIIGSVENTISKIAFTTTPQVGAAAVSGGDISNKITIETRSSLDNPVKVSQLTYIVLTSSSQTARLATNPTGPFSTSLVLTLQPGQSAADFYYTDTIQGTATMTAAEFPSVGWLDGTQPIEIKAGRITQLDFLTAPQTVLKNTASNIITVQARDVYGNAKAVDSDTLINLISTSGTGQFYSDAALSHQLTSLTMPANNAIASFYYEDGAAGSYALTASAPAGQNWVAANQSLTVTEPQLTTLQIQPDYAILPTDTNLQMTAIGYNSAGQAIPNVQVSWQVVNPAAGNVTPAGVLTTNTSVGAYTQVIKAEANGVTAYATVEVYLKPVTTIETQTPVPTVSSSVGGSILPVTVKVSVPVPGNPPTNALIEINDGAAETATRNVILSLYATGASYMKTSEHADFRDATAWQPYQTSENFNLSSGFSQKTIYVKYKNVAGDESAIASAHINYVKKLTTPAAAAGSSETYINRIIKNYNYIILHATSTSQAPQVPTVISPASNSFVLQNDLTITGQAPANTIVTLHIHSAREVIVKVVTDNSGKFVYKLDEATLDPGSHQIYASIDQTSGSLVGPATPFDLVAQPTVVSAPIVPLANVGFSISTSLWWWILGIWLFLMVVIFFGLDRIVVYAKANSRLNFGFLSTWPTTLIMSLFAAIMLLILLGIVAGATEMANWLHLS